MAYRSYNFSFQTFKMDPFNQSDDFEQTSLAKLARVKMKKPRRGMDAYRHLKKGKFLNYIQHMICNMWYQMSYILGHYKIDSWNFSTFFWFPSKMVSYGSLLAMVTTVFDKTQVWPRKSILSVKSYPDLAENHF